MPTAPTRATLLRDVCEALHGGGGFPSVGVSSGLGSATTLLDAVALLYADADVDALGNPVLRIDETVASGPTAGAYSTVRDGGLAPATGIITVSPAFTAAVQAGTDYSLWKVCHPSVAERALNRILRALRRDVLIPVTLLANGDFEVDVANWTGVNATPTRVTTAANVKHGAGAMKIDCGAGASTVTSESVRATPGEQLLLACFGQVAFGTLTLILLDGGSNEIAAASAVSPSGANTGPYQELVANGGPINAPAAIAGNANVAVRFKGTSASDEFYIDSVILWPIDQRWFELPSYVEDPNDVLDVGYFDYGRSLAGTNAYEVDEGRWISWGSRRKLVEEGGAHPFRIDLRTPVDRPLFVKLRRPFAEMTADTDSASVDRELVVQLTLREIYKHLRQEARKRKDLEAEKVWDEAIGEVNISESVRLFESRFGEQRMIVTTPQRRRYRGRYASSGWHDW